MKLKRYFAGVISEGKRVRWCKGEELRKSIITVFAYSIFFALFLMLSDALVIRLLQALNFN